MLENVKYFRVFVEALAITAQQFCSKAGEGWVLQGFVVACVTLIVMLGVDNEVVVSTILPRVITKCQLTTTNS